MKRADNSNLPELKSMRPARGITVADKARAGETRLYLKQWMVQSGHGTGTPLQPGWKGQWHELPRDRPDQSPVHRMGKRGNSQEWDQRSLARPADAHAPEAVVTSKNQTSTRQHAARRSAHLILVQSGQHILAPRRCMRGDRS